MPALIKRVQIGEIVAYVQKIDTQDMGESPNVNPAMITQVHDLREGIVDLAVFHSNGVYFVRRVPPGRSDERMTWHHIRVGSGPNG